MTRFFEIEPFVNFLLFFGAVLFCLVAVCWSDSKVSVAWRDLKRQKCRLETDLFWSLYARTIGFVFKWCPLFSLNWWAKIWVGRELIDEGKGLSKTDPKLSEYYQLLSITGLVAAFVLLSDPKSSPDLALLVAYLALYRALEILTFYLNWVFVEGGRIHNPMRSLLMTLINVVELGSCYGAVFFFGKLGGDSGPFDTVAEHIRNILMLDFSLPKNADLGEKGLLILEMSTVAFLLLIVIAKLAGAVVTRSREEGEI